MTHDVFDILPYIVQIFHEITQHYLAVNQICHIVKFRF